jgi:hypothetical protein
MANYISWIGHGSSCGEPPGVFTGCTMHLFGVAADRNVVQALADKFLNPISSPNLTYHALLDNALVTVLDVEKGRSATEAIGWLPGRECALWVPLLETRLLPFETRLVMWCPYIFISYAIGMITGREVWGWSKALADIEFPVPGASAPQFSVTTVIFEEFDPNKEGGDAQLLTIKGDAALSTASTWASLDTAAIDMIAKLAGVPPADVTSPFVLVPNFPAIALKQFRDSNTPNLACFQALINSPVHITNFGGGGFHPGNFTLEIKTCDSHPIVEKFLGGVPGGNSTTVPLNWAAWVKFDFNAIPGSVIAQTT